MSQIPTPHVSLLARLRPHSYREAIDPQNQVRKPWSSGNTNQGKQSHMWDFDNQNQSNKVTQWLVHISPTTLWAWLRTHHKSTMRTRNTRAFDLAAQVQGQLLQNIKSLAACGQISASIKTCSRRKNQNASKWTQETTWHSGSRPGAWTSQRRLAIPEQESMTSSQLEARNRVRGCSLAAWSESKQKTSHRTVLKVGKMTHADQRVPELETRSTWLVVALKKWTKTNEYWLSRGQGTAPTGSDQRCPLRTEALPKRRQRPKTQIGRVCCSTSETIKKKKHEAPDS
jgi:hypothetical protein